MSALRVFVGARCAAALALAVALFAPAVVRAQTMLDQEQRLIEVHSLLIALQPGNPPGALAPGELSLGVELISIPDIDGTTGGKRQITASDRTPLFPRPRFFIGLPAPDGFRAFAGFAYIPPVPIRDVSSHFGALEAGIAWAPPGPLSVGVRAHALLAESKSPVTDPSTRDVLDTNEFGADLSAGYRFDFGFGSVTPFLSAGVTRVAGDFHVTSDDALLTSRTTNPGFSGGARFFSVRGFEAVAEVVAFPGRLVHPMLRLAWTPDWLSRRRP